MHCADIIFSQRTFSTISRTSPALSPTIPAPVKPRPKVYYATVVHDFEAERTDELDAKVGDTVSVVAQSNQEWFVAKPIGKLGRPGLIPASFVEVKDPATGQITDIHTIIEQGGLPSVEDWKRDMLDYKANSIALGVIDDSAPPVTRVGVPNPPPPSIPTAPPVQYSNPMSPVISPTPPPPPPVPIIPEPDPQPTYDEYEDSQEPYGQPQDQPVLPDGILISANVVSFHYEMDEYWFRVHALFQPYAADPASLPPALQLVLFRAYNDFYDFQVELLNAYPREGGREPGFERVLPYMPGPADNVNNEITASRQVELDDYLIKMTDLRRSDARFVLEDVLVRQFLAPKPGDVETEVASVPDEVFDLQGQAGDDVEGDMAAMALNDSRATPQPPQQHRYNDYDYDDEAIRPVQSQQHDSYQSHNRSPSKYEESTLRPASSGRNPSPLPPHMRSEQIQSPDRSSHGSSNGYSNGHSNGYSNDTRARSGSGYDQDRSSAYSRSSVHDSAMPKSAGSQRSSGAGRSRSGSAAINSPPISASNPATAFVKIKVFDAATDDLIAVRVHPRVTHAQLTEKISARLGVQVTGLKYRGQGNGFVGVDDDESLYEWIETTDKLVLYAD
jgi:bud emergence protein 1